MSREEQPVNDPVATAATHFADKMNTDVLLYTGDIERGYDDKLLDLLSGMSRRENVLLVLCSHGGNPDAAYRMARGLQDAYEKFTVLLAGRCKSAGTLLALGAHELVMTGHAELGPLDVQFGKKDELFELDSGLTVLNALTELESKAFDLFEKTMLRIKVQSQGSVTFKTATHVATELAKGIVAPIMAQIDPMHVGEVSRALRIGEEYGRRLSAISGNLNPGALEQLVNRYPSHGFVIDRREAKELFQNVRDVSQEEGELVGLQKLRAVVRSPKNDDPILGFISNPRKEAAANEVSDPQDLEQGANSARTGSSADGRADGGDESSRSGAEGLGQQQTGTGR